MQKSKKTKVGKYKTVFKGIQYKIKRAEVILPSGKKTHYEMVEKTPGVMVLAVNEKRELILIREYRSRLKKFVWSLPGGKVNTGEKPIKAAGRELREETGHKAKKLRLFFFAGGGQSWVWKRYAYLAENLTLDPLAPDEDEDIREVISLPISEAFEMAKKNEIRNENMAYMICRLYFDQDKWLS